MDSFFLAQSIGIAGSCLGAVALLSRNDNTLKFMMSAFTAVMMLHFVMLEAYSGAMMCAISCLRFLISIWYRKTWVFLLLLIIGLVGGALTYQQPVDALPVIAGVCVTIGVFYMHGISMRLTLITASTCWLIHNYIQFSIGGILVEVLFIIVNSYTIRRLMREQALCAK